MPSILLCSSRDCMLLDCGEGAQMRLIEAGIDLSKIAYIVITHLHGDHFYGVYPLIDSYIMRVRSQKLKNKKLVIYAPTGFCKGFDNNFNDLITCVEVSKNTMANNGFVQMGDFKVRWLPMDHGDVEAFGIFIAIKHREKELGIFYSGDGICRDKCLEFLKNVRPCIIIHEASFLDYRDDAKKARERYHATVADAANLARESQAKMLILMHISSRYRSGEINDFISRAKRLFEGDIYIASDLSQVQLDRVTC
ncbi:MAG: MBL fold metallo-hydrolase [Ignisphaera sp.]